MPHTCALCTLKNCHSETNVMFESSPGWFVYWHKSFEVKFQGSVVWKDPIKEFLHDTFSRLYEMQVSFGVTKTTHMLTSQRGDFEQITTGTTWWC
jgi:hypothetical protein